MDTKAVKCLVCGCLCNGQEAGVHKELTKHNNWELIIDVNEYLLCLANQNLGALDSKDNNLVKDRR